MAADRRLYLFFKKRELGFAADHSEGLIKEGKTAEAKEWLAEWARRQMRSEGFPVPDEEEPVVILHGDWVGELEAQESTSAGTLLSSIRWYLHEQGRQCYVETFVPKGGAHIPLFWIGTYAMFPVWVREISGAAPAQAERTDEPRIGSAARASSVRGLRHPLPQRAKPAFAGKETEKLSGTGNVSGTWRDVYVFISSTFNDMHAERNYLVKRVFPQLSDWCASHHLRLRDIDLRWGVTEEDSRVNHRTVEICLENIDRCRPLFLCFLGQRRGSVLKEKEISRHTYSVFPGLQKYPGSSLTELEIIHSMIEPMRKLHLDEADTVQRSFFYFRDDSYLTGIRNSSLKAVYTNSASDDPDEADRQLASFKKRIIETRCPCRTYTCRWDENSNTPELAFVKGAGPDITRGGLTDFTCGQRPLCDRVIEDLKSAITERYLAADEEQQLSPLASELEEQSKFLSAASEAFIERPGALAPFENYVNSDTTRPLILTASAGMGKSSLLAYWISRAGYKIYYRFAGGSKGSNTAADLAYSLWQQLYEDKKTGTPPPENTAELFRQFGKLLAEASAEYRLVLVIDSINQLSGGVNDASFLPQVLPPDVRLIISVREDSPGAERYLSDAGFYADIIRLHPMDDAADRRAIAQAYLKNYLKELDPDQLEALINSPGAENPLYLKIVLSELRVQGAFEAIRMHIEHDYGSTPLTAFNAMLSRLENDQSFSDISMKKLVSSVFGWLSHSRYGLSAGELAELLVQHGDAGDTAAAQDAVYILMRQLRPFLTEREHRTDFFYDSFKEACIRRYTKDKPAEQWHAEISGYFERKEVSDTHRLLEHAWQLIRAERKQEYLNYVFDYRYLRSKLNTFGVQSLIGDYSLYDTEDTSLMVSFLWLAGSVLSVHPDQLASRLYGHFGNNVPSRIRNLLADARIQNESCWLRPLIPCFEEPGTGSDRVILSGKELSPGIALLRNDTLAAVVENEQAVCICEVSDGAERLRIPASKSGRIVNISSASQGRKLVVCEKNRRDSSMPGEIIVYETGSFSVILRFPAACTGVGYKHYGSHYYSFTGFDTAGDLLIIKDGDHLIGIYDLNTGKAVGQCEYRWKAACFALSETGTAVIGNIHPQNDNREYDNIGFRRIANPVSLMRLDRNTGTLKLSGQPLGEWRSEVRHVGISPDGKYIAGSDLHSACVYRTDTGIEAAKLDTGDIRSFCFLKKRKLLIAAGRSFLVYDTESFRLIKAISGLGQCQCAAVSENESFAVIVTDFNRLRVVSLADIEKEKAKTGVPMPVRSVCLSRDGRYVYASCYDNWVGAGKELAQGKGDMAALYLIDKNNGKPLKKMKLCGRFNRDFTYLTPDGSAVVGRDYNDPEYYMLRYWELPEDPLSGDGSLYAATQLLRKEDDHASGEYADPDRMQLSSDRKYFMITHGGGCRVYRARTGRYMGKISFRVPASDAAPPLNKETGRRGIMERPFYDTADDGKTIYVVFANSEMPRIERYNVHDDILEFSHSLDAAGFIDDRIFSSSSGINVFCQITDGKSKIAFVNRDTCSMLSVPDGRRYFHLNKIKSRIWADDYFAACSSDGTCLAVSGKMDNETDWMVMLYDTVSGALLASFAADGSVSELRFEDDNRTLLFGMGNGRICRLCLEGQTCLIKQ